MIAELDVVVQSMRNEAGWRRASADDATAMVLDKYADRLATLRAGVVGEVTDEMVGRAGDALIPDAVRDRYGYRRGMTVRRFIAEAERGDADEVIRAALTAALGRTDTENR